MSAHPRCDQTASWAALRAHFDAQGRGFDLRQAFAADAGRFANWSFSAGEVFADLSKNLVDEPTLALLLQMARDCGLEAQREALFAGEPVNVTEGRAALHTALRAPAGEGPFSDEVQAALARMLDFAERVREVASSGIRDIVHIGIGGSDLGPAMVVGAMQSAGDSWCQPWQRLHFVSNVDGHQLATVLSGLEPERTLFVIASKTFTTQETLANALAARDWYLKSGGTDVAGHFVATTSNATAAAQFGIETCFGFWDWVGGRYSLWSVIGLPIAIAIGAENFRAFLAGAHEIDQHFLSQPAERNLPVLLGLLDIWYRNFHGFTSRCIAPYHQGLARLPAYLQQLEMESNGKRVDREGQVLPFDTCPVIWGEPGTNGQHAFFQMLHQGTDAVPVEFIAVREPDHGSQVVGELAERLREQHRMLLANCLAQSQALMQGKTLEQALHEKPPTASRQLGALTVARHRSFPGNRPSTTLLLQRLTPRALGALIALYEHRVFVAGAMWGINSFDQWGVELGKALCGELLPRLSSGDVAGLDGSSAGLLAWLRQGTAC